MTWALGLGWALPAQTQGPLGMTLSWVGSWEYSLVTSSSPILYLCLGEPQLQRRRLRPQGSRNGEDQDRAAEPGEA